MEQMLFEPLTALLKVSIGVLTAMSVLLLNYNLRYFLMFLDDQTFWLYHFCVATACLLPIMIVFGVQELFSDWGSLQAVIVCLFMIPTLALLMRQQQE
jgi:hypothetical protein